MNCTKLTIKILVNALVILLLFVGGNTKAQNSAPAPKDTTPELETIKCQFLRYIDNSIGRTSTYLSTQTADSIDVGYSYTLLDIIKRKFELRTILANRDSVEKKFPEIKQGRLKLYGLFYADNNTIPYSKEELDKLKNEPITTLYDDKYLLGISFFCKQLSMPAEYVTTFQSRILKYQEEGKGLDPITAGIAYINLVDNKCYYNKDQLQDLKAGVVDILLNKNAGNLKTALELGWFYKEEMNVMPYVLAMALEYYIGKCDILTYKMLFKLFEGQNKDGGWHPLIKEEKSTFSASVCYLWLLLEIRDKIDIIDKSVD